MAEKPHMNIVFIGHVDHGKSTTVGRILLDTGAIDKYVIDKFKKEAEEKGKATFEFAWVMDNLKEERERGVTIDVSHKKFVTDKYYFTVIDAPGHRDFVKNMITGTSQADAAIVVVSAKDGPQAQTKEHIFLAKTLGVKQIIIALNKMDDTKPAIRREGLHHRQGGSVQAAEDRRLQARGGPVRAHQRLQGRQRRQEVRQHALVQGRHPGRRPQRSEVAESQEGKALRLPIQDVYTITGIGTVPVGRVETGILKPDMKIIFMPSNKIGEVKTIEMHHEQLPSAKPGDNVGFNVRGIAKNDIKRGDVAGPVDNPPTVAKTFVAQIVVLNHPTAIPVGYTPVFHCHTAQVACTFIELQKTLDPKTGQIKEENPTFLKTGDVAIVKVEPTKPMVVEKAKDFPQLGRFAIRDMGADRRGRYVHRCRKEGDVNPFPFPFI